MGEVKLTTEELNNLKEDSYFRGATITGLKEIHKHIERIDKHLERSNGNATALMKRQENLATHSRIHWLLISALFIIITKIVFFKGGG